MTDTTPSYGASPTALTVTNLQSLADGAFWQSAAQDNDTAGAMLVRIFLTIVTTTTAAAAVGDIRLLVAGSVDGGTDFAGGASGTEGAYTVVGNSDDHLTLLDFITIDATETTARTYEIEVVLENVPKDYSLIIEQNTGAALASSGNSVEILIEKFSQA